MKVLVTGGAGYLGSVLCKRLVQTGHQVRVLDKGYWGYGHVLESVPEIDLRQMDIRGVGPAELDGVDAVIHLAGLSNDPTSEFRPEANQAVNVEAAEKLWRVCRAVARPLRVLCASTASLYDGTTDHEAEETADPGRLCLKYPYSHSKYVAERALFDCADHPGNKIQAAVLRMGTLWGLSPRMRTDLAINAMTLSATRHRRITVHCDGLQWRPMCHVVDAANAYIRVLETPAIHGAVFNVVAENWLLLDLAHQIAKACSRADGLIDVHVTYGDERRRSYRVSGARLRAGTGWTPTYVLQTGIAEMVNAWANDGIPDQLQGSNIAWMEHLLSLEPFFRRNPEVL